jgi:uncharacterized phage protein (TIGR01671 family)
MEIKFRGKSEYGRWVEGDLICYKNGGCSINRGFSSYGCEASEIINRIEVEPKTVGQFIGKLDSNGKEIYVGDIVETFSGEYYYGTWEYSDKILVKDIRTCLYELENCDEIYVIGNIHDNLDLLSLNNEGDKL